MINQKFLSMKSLQDSSLLTTDEASRILEVSSKTVLRFCQRKEDSLPHFLLGDRYRFLLTDLIQFKNNILTD